MTTGRTTTTVCRKPLPWRGRDDNLFVHSCHNLSFYLYDCYAHALFSTEGREGMMGILLLCLLLVVIICILLAGDGPSSNSLEGWRGPGS